MLNRFLLTVIWFVSLVGVLAYKVVVHEEPWAIGMTQVIFLGLTLSLLYLTALNGPKIRSILRQFFQEADSPFNIAVFRIAFFSFLLFLPVSQETVWYSSFPKDLQFAPMGMGWLLSWLPINPSLAYAACLLFKAACFLSIIGLWTRGATAVAAILGFYVIGIPNFYGNVAHDHHLFWFLTIFAYSRAGDALSMDALMAGLKKAELNDLSTPQPSKTYAQPLRFIWILMGLCYFFPGFWKFWKSGSAWIVGDNLQRHLYYDWMGFDNWLPVCRIDHYPWLCHIGGTSVILFELAFLFLIFHPLLRYVAFGAGLFFHNMTNFLMKIDFYDLQICYVSFLKWDRIFAWCGQRFFPEPLIVLFDGSCSFCRKAIAVLKVFDIFGRINYLDLHGSESASIIRTKGLEQDDLMKDMHALAGPKILKGFNAYQEISARIPLFWLVRPFLYLPFVQILGDRIYRNVADHRACKLVPKTTSPVTQKETPAARFLIPVALILITGNVIFGFMGKGSGWPFACYPTFSEIPGEIFTTIDCQIIYPDGSEKVLPLQSLKSHTGSYRIVGLVGKILAIKDTQVRQEKFKALWTVLVGANAELKQAKTVRFYFVENHANPDQWASNPIRKNLASEFEINQ
jgi:predicted DCC family thiol-disulfide oxidoreductase YuxK